MKDLFAKLVHNYRHVMVQVIPVILTFHTHGTGISAGIISDLYRDYICSGDSPAEQQWTAEVTIFALHQQSASDIKGVMFSVHLIP